MPLVNPQIWNVSDGIEISEKILNEIIKNTSDNLLITAGPGTGKTELLAQRACFLLQTGECKFPRKILSLCFKVDAAKNLKERVLVRCQESYKNNFISMTFDAFFISIIRKFSSLLPGWLNKPSLNFEVGEFKQFYNLPPDLNEITNEQTRKDLNKYISTNQLHWSICRSLAYTIIKNNDSVKNLISNTYSYIFLDEFQDTTTTQYKFIKELFCCEKNKITAVGDTNQMIMCWAGANKNIFGIYQNDFKAIRKELNINHRSNKNIVDFINCIGQNITIDNETFVKYESTKEDNNEHSIFAHEYNDKIEEASAIVTYINNTLQNNKLLLPDDFALIIRQKAADYYKQVKPLFDNANIELRNEDRLICTGGLKIQEAIEEPLSNLFLNIFRKREKIINSNYNKDLIYSYSQLRNIDISNERQYKKIIEEINNIAQQINYNSGIEYCTDMIIKSIGTNIKRYKILSNESDYVKVKKSFDIFFQECYNNSPTLNCAIDKYLGKNQVKLMTVHKSKGLEFNTVFFVDFNSSSWWGLNKAYRENNPDKILEEKNTFFVGASRAKEKLIFTNSEKNNWPTVITDILNTSEMIDDFVV